MKAAHACWAGVALGMFVGPAFATDNCRHAAERNAELPVSGVKRVVIDASAGELQVLGEPERALLTVKGRACAARESTLDEIQLKTRRDGETIYVTADLPDHAWNVFDWAWGELALDLVITVPESVALDIHDSSGAVLLRNVGSTKLDDSSGSLQVEGVRGDLDVDDGSGSIEIRDVRGKVTLADGSGSASVQQVGSVRVTDDGSGSLTIRDVSGDVTIDDDGSGSIDIANVKGDVDVRNDGSGGITVAQVGGSLHVGDDGSGGVHYEGVTGNVRIARD